MNNDLISRSYLKNLPFERVIHTDFGETAIPIEEIDNAPSVETYTIEDIQEVRENALILGAKLAQRPQGEYVDISKLRLMTVEECAGHTIEYAMGWKACIEWIKKGGAE